MLFVLCARVACLWFGALHIYRARTSVFAYGGKWEAGQPLRFWIVCVSEFVFKWWLTCSLVWISKSLHVSVTFFHCVRICVCDGLICLFTPLLVLLCIREYVNPRLCVGACLSPVVGLWVCVCMACWFYFLCLWWCCAFKCFARVCVWLGASVSPCLRCLVCVVCFIVCGCVLCLQHCLAHCLLGYVVTSGRGSKRFCAVHSCKCFD